ncbi:MAG: PDDEXK nuclease domain-containing protein [Lachnospiraceae bacterium]|jgi:predicted nuclease of restriction endonuclease-like (RecB) superfamily|nr:PDDEXK nuclease domain-containing protein [Lachnospiraceae bacterium]MCI1329209.1 PDDEXK nuclease domain-containing protein [Lachnospiraceae bacterium]
MSNLIKTDESYRNWVSEISKEFRRSQIKAATHVNAEMLMFFWRLGRDIHAMMEKNIYGSAFFNNLSKDLKDVMPDIKSFSVTNLHYMVWFYELYPDALNLPQPGVNSESKSNLPQAGEDSEKPVFRIPWGHNKLIIDKCKGNPDKAEFYAEKTLENNWSRVVLLNFLGTDLYERQGKAVTNFALTLPKPQSDLAQEITRDPYNFDFLTIRETYDEKELKDALMDNIEKFLLELGNGFAFVGREVRLEMGETENFMDMLFYNIKLHCYVVVEVKVREFESSDMGQLGTYMVAVNHQMKGEIDGPTLGLLICKSKDNVKAKYALEASSQPMGISEYDISTFLPDKYKSSLPTIEEIEAELTDGPINEEGGQNE